MATGFNGVKVFSASTAGDREALGSRVTQWLREHADFTLIGKHVMQSSDARYHCISIVLFFRAPE